MYVVGVTIHVKSEYVDSFVQATLENARQTRKEPGNLRFDVLQAEEDADRFFLYECYQSPHDFSAHQQTDHYLKWRETVQDWMAEKRIGVKYNSLFFDDQVM